MENAIVLCSGGLDSVVTSHYVKKRLKYNNLIVLFFDYNQKTLKSERRFSKECAKELNSKFIEIKLDWLAGISKSLINIKGNAKKLSRKDLKNTKKESEKYYVPCRNTLFLVYSLALAESLFIKEKKKYDIFVGFKNEGKESFPDATKKFVKEINKLSNISTTGKFKIYSPLIGKDKEDIILLGKRLQVNFRKTISCYLKNKQCGKCLACMLRKEGFYWANIKNPDFAAS